MDLFGSRLSVLRDKSFVQGPPPPLSPNPSRTKVYKSPVTCTVCCGRGGGGASRADRLKMHGWHAS